MRLKRNLILGMMSIMLVFGAIVAYAAEKRDYGRYYPGDSGKATLEAYAYINESGWGRHIGNASGSLYGDDKAAAGTYRVEAYYGKYEPTKTAHKKGYIGLGKPSYAVSLVKTAWFDSVYTDIYKEGNTEEILASASVVD